MKKRYKNPVLRVLDLTTEGVIATSFVTSDETITSDEMMTNQKDPDMWGNESVWK